MKSPLFVDLSQRLGHRARPWADVNVRRWDAGRFMDTHGHRFLQTIHVLDGALEVDTGDGWMAVGPGMVHLLPPGFTHRLRTRTGHRQFGTNFTVEPDERGVLLALRRAFSRPAVIRIPATPPWTEQTHQMRLMVSDDLEALRILHDLDEYALALLRCGRPAGERPLARRLLDTLHARLDGPLRVERVAEDLGVSRATLQRVCRRHFGGGVAHLHERLRLQRAARRLLQEDRTVSDCADEAGYPDLYQFSRSFKRVFSCPPSEYRRHKEEAMR